MAVLNMMLYFIINSKLYKEDFITSRTEGFENFLKEMENLKKPLGMRHMIL